MAEAIEKSHSIAIYYLTRRCQAIPALGRDGKQFPMMQLERPFSHAMTPPSPGFWSQVLGGSRGHSAVLDGGERRLNRADRW